MALGRACLNTSRLIGTPFAWATRMCSRWRTASISARRRPGRTAPGVVGQNAGWQDQVYQRVPERGDVSQQERVHHDHATGRHGGPDGQRPGDRQDAEPRAEHPLGQECQPEHQPPAATMTSTRLAVAELPPLSTAARLASGTATSSANESAMTTSCTVAGSTAPMSDRTGRWLTTLVPRSPCNRLPTYRPYCTMNRLIQAHLHAHALDLFRRGPGPRRDLGLVSGDHLGHDEDDGDQAEQGQEDGSSTHRARNQSGPFSAAISVLPADQAIRARAGQAPRGRYRRRRRGNPGRSGGTRTR